MKTLYRYLLMQVVATLLMSVLVCTGVLLLGNVLKDVTELLQNTHVSLGVILQAILLLLPFVLVFALPLGMLTATLLVFGRLSADQELTAIRSSGVSLLSLASPVILFALCMSVLSGWMNMEIGPRARVAYKQLTIDVGLKDPLAVLQEGKFITEFPDHIIYVGDNRDGKLKDMWIYHLDKDEKVDWRLQADSGKLVVDKAKKLIYFELEGVYGLSRGVTAPAEKTASQTATNAVDGVTPPNDDANPPAKEDKAPAPDALEDVSNWFPFYAGSAVTDPIDFEKTMQKTRQPKISEMTFGQLLDERARLVSKHLSPAPVEVHLHRQISFSFACLGFTLVGIPLGIRAHRRETTAGIFMAFVLMILYYSFIVLGQSLETRPSCYPQLIVWIPTFLFQGIGAWLLWRANRRG